MIDYTQIPDLALAVSELREIDAPWCICGGWAIDLFIDKQTRDHKDVDISIRRSDQLQFQSHLQSRGWQLEIAENGLHPWQTGDFLQLPANTIWCKRDNRFLELLFDEWDDATFRYRKKQSISMPSTDAILTSKSGLKILAPEIVLLYKASAIDNADYQSDFEGAYPQLPDTRREWLMASLADIYGQHNWLKKLTDA